MSQIRIFIAEDINEEREMIVTEIHEFFNAHPSQYSIDTASSFQSALQKLHDSEKKGEYYDIFFSDIDFREDYKGGKRDSGYELITKAFEICPATHIVTYSGQHNAKDLVEKYENLRDKGLIVRSMDKEHSGDPDWMQIQIGKIVTSARESRVMHDLWKNHSAIVTRLNAMKLDADQFGDLAKKNSIRQNLESAFTLQKNLTRIDEKTIFYRLMIYLYHAALEQFLKADHTDDEIMRTAEQNKPERDQLLRDAGYLKDDDYSLSNRVSAKHVLLAFCPKGLFRYAHLLNVFRNKSIHETKDFRLDQANVMFAHLTFATCVLAPHEIAYSEIEKFISGHTSIDDRSRRNLNDLIRYLKQ